MWEISLLGTRLCKHLLGSLRESIQVSDALEYWVTQKQRFTNATFVDVDWKANKMAMKSVSSSRRHWVTKFQAGICGTGRMMKRWNQRVISNCPRCGMPDETTTHVLLCRCDSTEEIWKTSKISLEKWMNEYKTCPDFKSMLLQFIEQWRLGREVSNITHIEFESAQGIFAEQKKIGWRNMIGGCFSNV